MRRASSCEWREDGTRCAAPKVPGRGRHYCAAHDAEADRRRQRGQWRRYQANRRARGAESVKKATEVRMESREDAHSFAIRFMLRKG